MAKASMTSKLVAEFVGTFLLVFTIGCVCATGNPDFAGYAIGTVLFIAIMALGGVSGANFNPAVSVTLGITKSMGGPGMAWKEVAMFSAVQVMAGLAAAFGYIGLLGKPHSLEVALGFSNVTAGGCELLYTFMLCFVVLNVAAAKKNETEKNQYFGLAIGFCVVAGAYGAGAISGGCFNPAVALGLGASSSTLTTGLLYVPFELIGAVLAAMLFRMVRPEDFGDNKGYFQMFLSEFLGTYILVLTVGLNVMARAQAAALSIACSLAAMIFALGDVSGAHFNPAVTFAVFCSGRDEKLSVEKASIYMFSQVAGAVSAAATYSGIYGFTGIGGLKPVEPYNLSQALMAEAVFTFMLTFTVLCVAVSALTKSSEYFGLAIGFCVVVGGFACGNISGGSLNPAVSCGIASFGGGYSNMVAYSTVELLAGAIAAAVFKLTHNIEFEREEAEPLKTSKV